MINKLRPAFLRIGYAGRQNEESKDNAANICTHRIVTIFTVYLHLVRYYRPAESKPEIEAVNSTTQHLNTMTARRTMDCRIVSI
ncbi:hypothetical protein DERF_014368 [Dermatophagoides farinae]|uniref:Uncharacterized protein n=1 Tax=Dermatophagoides farinae TaxID=6954 RepID=A0A922HI56_DERFA|nr:hypothetical protein DERF_014368 [Dermatophagoides farinae]